MLQSPDLSAFDLDLEMALAEIPFGSPSSPTAPLVPDDDAGLGAFDGDLSEAVLNDLAAFDSHGYDLLGKCTMPAVTVGGGRASASAPPAPPHPHPYARAPTSLFGGGGRATPSPFSSSSDVSEYEHEHDLPPIKAEELSQLSRPALANLQAPDPADSPALKAYVQRLFPKDALRSSPSEWKLFRTKVKGLGKEEQKMVATLRRKELSCVYAEKARQRRIKTAKCTGEANQQLERELAASRDENSKLRAELAALRKKCGGRGRK